MQLKNLQLKRAVATVLFVLLTSAVGMTNAMAQTFTSGSLRYTVTGDNTVKVIGHVNGTNATGSLTIPASVVYDNHTYAVTAIGNSAFSGCSGFTGNLTIGNNVSSIGASAFNGCTGFVGELTMTHETTVGNYAFYNCSSLTGSPSIILTGAVGENAFNGCSSLAGEITIGEGVTSIGASAFRNCSSITAVHFNAVSCADMGHPSWIPFPDCSGVLEIGSSVERIPNHIFVNADFTGSLVIPDSVTAIGERAFYQCSGFNGSLTIGNGVTTIGNEAFANCSGFTGNLTIGNSVSSIGASAFSGCTGFAGELTMTHETTVGNYAFYNCSSLTGSPSIILTGAVGENAFNGCSSLAGEITIGEGVTSIGASAFRNCSSITAVHFNAVSCADMGHPSWIPFPDCSGVLEIGSSVERIPNHIFVNADFTGSLVIPDSVTAIGERAFYQCSGFNGSLTIGNGVTTIGNEAFANCSGFTGNLTIGNSVSSIGASAFSGCTGFAGELTMTHELAYIGNSAFYNCYGLIGSPSIALTGTIGSSAFYGCSSLTGEITIGEAVTSVGDNAFRNCSSITAVYFNAVNCADMGHPANVPFSGCTGVLEIGTSVERIPLYMFLNAAFTGSLVIPDSVTEISNKAFENCTGFNGSLTIGNNVSSIGTYAFSGCTGFIGELTMTHETTVGNYAFYNCYGLIGNPSIVLTGAIGEQAFDGCSSLAGEITIGEAVTSIGVAAFRNCSSITAVHFNAVNCADMGHPANVPFPGCTGVLEIGTSVERIPQYMFRNAAFTGSLMIPDSVTEICGGAFSNCSGFNGSLTIGNGVTTIGNEAFYNCSGFTGNLTIGNNVSSIGASAFSGCTGFTGELTMTHETTVGSSAFYNCYGLTGSPSIVLTGAIGSNAFDGCSSLAGVFTIEEGVTSIGSNAFRNCSSITAVHFNAVNCADMGHPANVPFPGCKGVLEIGTSVERIPQYMFRNAAFTGSLMIPDSVTEICGGAFSNCSGFNGSLTIGNGVTTIGNEAFYSCSGFTGNLTIGSNVSSIGASAFSGCSGFTGELTMTHELAYIGNSAFYNCYGLIGNPSIALTGTIGSSAFYGCSSLTGEITIGEAVTSVGDNAFRNCSSITAVHFNAVNCADMGHPANVPFTNCTGVLEIGTSVERIPLYMFRNAAFTAIRSFAEVPPTVGTDAFYNVNHEIPVIVPCGSLEDYQNADGWSTFTNINDDCPVPHVITATANPTIGGTITGAGTYYLGDMATLTANANEGFAFVNWTKDGTVVSTNPTYSFMVLEDASFVANFEMIIVTQTATLVSGWNWWSTYAGQNYIDGLSLLEESLGGNGSVIKSQNAFVEYSSTSGWAGTLQSINNESSYKILVAEDCTSEINGSQLLPENHPITLDPGWTWIGYLMEQPQTITTALGNYEPSVNDILKGQGGYAIYLPNIGWLPANFTLNPGIGYQYYSMQPESQTLMYANSRENAPAVEPDNRYWQNNVHAYADNLCLMAVVTIDGTEQRSKDLELGAFVNGECRGSAKLLYIEPLDRYYAMMTITGQNDEVVEFALFDESRHLGSALSTTHLTFSSNAIVGTYDVPFEVAFSALTAIEEHTATLYLYPNPVNRNETFNIVIPEDETVVEMTVMNEIGAVVLCEKGIDIKHSVLGLSASGLYMIRVVSKSGKVYQSRLVVR